ncbi:MAG: M91 family zinc metallopeptidase [Xanthobacteraceae bacterium]
MGTWPDRKYKEYVEKNASPADAPVLLAPASEQIDPTWPNIQVTFFPMNDWMNWYDIVLDDSAFRLFLHRYRRDVKHYKDDVRKQFEPIKRCGTGLALLNEIGRTKGVAKIRPYWNWSDIVNAEAKPEKNRDATAQGQPVTPGAVLSLGSGKGTNSTIGYTPQMWGRNGASKINAPGYEPDEIIFHEMVHASRQMRGVQEAIKVTRGYDDMEEYLATVVTNIYMSHKGKAALGGDHGTATLKDPDRFLDNAQHISMSPRALMRKLRGRQNAFYADLARFGPPRPRFNPVWQFDQEVRAGQNKP